MEKKHIVDFRKSPHIGFSGQKKEHVGVMLQGALVPCVDSNIKKHTHTHTHHKNMHTIG